MALRASQPPVFSRLLITFETRPFRRLWLSTFLSSMGSWIVRLAIGWLVLELTDSAFWVGLVASLEGAGQVAVGLFAGILADRFDRRKLLMGAYFASGALTLLVGWLAVSGRIALWHLVAAALLKGALFAVQTTAYNTVLYEMAGPQRLMNANAIKMLCFNLARIVGSALAGGVIAAAGVGPSYLIAGVVICAAAIPLRSVTTTFKRTAPLEAFWRAAGQGIGYVWKNASLRTLLLLSAAIETFAFCYQTMLPVIARDVLGVGAAGLGWLSSAGGVGAVAGTLLTLGISHTRRKADWLLVGASLSGLSLVFFGMSRWYALSLVLVAFVSLSLMVYDVLMNTLFQLLTADEVRGRVMSVYTLTYGLNAVGGTVAGAIAAAAGAPAAVAVTGGIVLAYLLPTFRTIRQVRPSEQGPAA